MADIKEARDEILDRRKGNKQPSGVNPTPQRVNPTVEVPHTSKEPDSGVWGLPHGEMEGSGVWGISNSVATHGSVDPNALVARLHLSLASIQAGNTSLKLKKQVNQMLGLLVKQTELTQKEAHKILSNII